jgi:hypothetical protein
VLFVLLGNFAGGGYALLNSKTNYGTMPAPFNTIQDNSWSLYKNGTAGSAPDIEFYRNTSYGGEVFVLCRAGP